MPIFHGTSQEYIILLSTPPRYTCTCITFLPLMLAHRCEKRQQSRREQSGGSSYEQLEEDILDDEGMIDESKLGPPFGIVINGHSLVSR